MLGLFMGIILTVHGPIGFYMNWNGQLQPGEEGYEYHLLVLTICSGLLILGGVRFSVDRFLQKKIVFDGALDKSL